MKREMTRVALYARYSSDLQSAASIQDQLRLCRARVEREGWREIAAYSDRALSGASMLRPGLQDLLASARRGDIDIILAEALDRLSRDQADIAMLFKVLAFAGVRIVTLAEGEISELHVGLKGTMNQLFLKDLAAKTRRGLEGRVRKGKSGGGLCYGYDVVRGEERGDRTINVAEAEIVNRIYTEFAAGRSPKAIARRLNEENIPGPRGKLWRDTAIRGHRQRGTGILNNELYIGRLIWNRLHYQKDPETGRRVSRQNPPEDWVIEDVPHLRIIEDALWKRVKARQREIDATPAVRNIKASRFWERRRSKHLLTGLVVCGACGGGVAAVGRDYLACSNARKLGTCSERKSIRRAILEDFVLDLVRERLMRPEAVKAFIAAYHQEINRDRDAEEAGRAATEKELRRVADKLDGLYDAIADGLRTPGLMAKLETLEAEKADLEARLAAPPPSPVRLHPNLAELYREKVAALGTALKDPAIRDEAIGLFRTLVRKVTLIRRDERWEIDLEGEICALVAMGMQKKSGGNSVGAPDIHVRSVKVVAGAGFVQEPTLSVPI